jgi:phage gp36-like protein
MNSYLAVRYVTPIDISLDASLPPLLLGVMLDIAIYLVLLRSPEVGEQIIAQYERRIAWLKSFKDGDVALPGAVELPGAGTIHPTAFWSGSNRELSDTSPRISTRVTMEGL